MPTKIATKITVGSEDFPSAADDVAAAGSRVRRRVASTIPPKQISAMTTRGSIRGEA